MNGANLLLDTNIVIFHLHGNKTAYNLIANNSIFISVITEMELLSFRGLSKEEENTINELLSVFTIINLKDSIKNKAINLRKEHNFKLPDAIIVALASYLNCSFVSDDKKLLDINEVSGVALDI